MRATILALFLGLAMLPATVCAAGVPILAGPWTSNEEGYGRVRPRRIYTGGDALGGVSHIEWLTRGGPRAVGTGMSTYVSPTDKSSSEGTPQSVVVVLFKLGRCHGHAAYNSVEWYFPEYGQHFSVKGTLSACTGSEA